MAAMSLDISGNFVFGSKLKYGHRGEPIHDVDVDQSGWYAICSALHNCSIQTLNISDIGMGPKGAATLGEMLMSASEGGGKLMGAMSSLDISGNGIEASDLGPLPQALLSLVSRQNCKR